MRRNLLYSLVLVSACLTVACAQRSPNSHARGPYGRTSCSGVLSGDSTVYDSAQVTEQPVIRTGPRIEYPPAVRQERIQGRVVIAATIEPDGRPDPTSLTVLRSVDRALDAASMQYLLRALFWPGCLDGRAVRVRIRVPIDFRVFG
jgi:TonB family protein